MSLACTYKHSLEGRRKMTSTATRKAGYGVRFAGITIVYHRFSSRILEGKKFETWQITLQHINSALNVGGGRATTPPPQIEI
jgi:hypothetical protein